MYRILIVEDDTSIAEAISKQAKAWDLETKPISDFRNVMAEFSAFDPHLVLMDLALPFFDGFYWCREIRKVSKVPVIFISSASDDMNIIMAMNMGGDDFIAKPFQQRVMMAKIQAMLRRTYDFGSKVPVIEHRGALLNMGEGVLIYQDNRIELSKNDYRILSTLMENKGEVVSREKLMKTLWESDSFVDENALNVNIGRLRKKLEAAGLVDFIETKFGIGYIVK